MNRVRETMPPGPSLCGLWQQQQLPPPRRCTSRAVGGEVLQTQHLEADGKQPKYTPWLLAFESHDGVGCCFMSWTPERGS
mmetsp:Transcript_66052/g.166525  ORF Transcript_66052/g.166525 Transcript_66052/m.166525 type:complete len:80 (+) Transcript_66052:2704-2943(+)